MKIKIIDNRDSSGYFISVEINGKLENVFIYSIDAKGFQRNRFGALRAALEFVNERKSIVPFKKTLKEYAI